jgi:hypothetical protein
MTASAANGSDSEEEPPKAESRWVAAADEVRGSVKWLAGGIATGVSLVFGAGPLISNETDASSWAPARWLVVLLAAVVAALCAGGLIRLLLAAVRPVELTLDRLPQELLDQIVADARAHLPSRSRTLEEFRDRRTAYAVSVATLKRQLAEAKLAAGTKPGPSTRKKLASLATQLEAQVANRDLYEETKDELFNSGKYIIESANVDNLTEWPSARLLAGLILASVIFTFATHTPAESEEASKAESDIPAAPQGATIDVAKGENASNAQEFWDQLGLEACRVGGEVPVILLEASGEAVTQYRLQTLGEPAGCGRYTFQTSEQVVSLVIPEPRTVKLSPQKATPDKDDDNWDWLKTAKDWFLGTE